jgi:DNA repair/transcription protein MET18/MMS19
MAGVNFNELALQYVLSDEGDQERMSSAVQAATTAIESTPNNRLILGQWVSSINRWMPAGRGPAEAQVDQGEEQDDDFIARAKGTLSSSLCSGAMSNHASFSARFPR